MTKPASVFLTRELLLHRSQQWVVVLTRHSFVISAGVRVFCGRSGETRCGCMHRPTRQQNGNSGNSGNSAQTLYFQEELVHYRPPFVTAAPLEATFTGGGGTIGGLAVPWACRCVSISLTSIAGATALTGI